MAWPIFRPPPATSADITGDQWSRPPSLPLIFGRAAELAPHHRHHVVVHAAVVQVLDQVGDAAIELGQLPLAAS